MLEDENSRRAREVHFSSLVFDTHTDTPQRILFDKFDLGHRDGAGCVDIPRLRDGGVGAVFFALWVPVDITGEAATRRARDLLDATAAQIELHARELALCDSVSEIKTARAANKIAVLLGLEGGHAINADLAVLREFHARGLRYMTLTHNAATEWADSSSTAAVHHGLSDFGREVIREMNRLGMMVDVSHVSDATFDDVLATSRAPVIASHSGCRALCDAPRNLDDERIRRLAAAGGVMHVVFHNSFLSQEYASAYRSMADQSLARQKELQEKFGQNEARILMEGQRWNDALILGGKLPRVSWEKIVDHIDHAVRVAGADHVGIGSDFDGAFMPQGMEDASKLPRITEGLIRRGYPDADIRKILGENTLRVMVEVQRVSNEPALEKS
jgi:membrane dipeptidase